MVYKCLIVDDESLARELLETHLSQLENFKVIASCSSAIEAHKILQTENVDLLFLDIEMPVLKGTDFFKTLKQKPRVIFTTAYREYAIEGFELNAVDYLLKPITFVRFFQAIEKFVDSQKSPPKFNENIPTQESYIFVQSNKKNIKINFDDVTYIESIKDYIRIHLPSSSIMVKHGITAFEEKLDERFLRVHRSYIVNTTKVSAYTRQDVEIGSIEIPFGDFYKANALKVLKEL
ncbi:LytTR family DNA-binding domain-containing protein [Tenacibaculum sp. SG-28]|uniref:LytR/AlgR family response regulator transcription factor n=1 Tax=Tenacibaculum sp. SG-28 TaxID=754426 RepID=UPI000CF46AC2|nr:response regulator transcription factor [Tenacibaculum sp. SG-28]PQJ21719.1 DNA-binding response regulator [Tenacibaculum sp. SG-28]